MTDAQAEAPMPRYGTTSYRRRVLEAAASESFDEFADALNAAWPAYGWRLMVDMCTEMLANLANVVPPGNPRRDGFGRLELATLLPRMNSAEMLDNVLAMASSPVYEDLAPHEAFTRSVAQGQEVEAMTDSLFPAWQRALNDIQEAGGRREPGAAVMAAWLSRHPNRNEAAYKASYLQFCYLRKLCLPQGQGWISGWLARSVPDLSSLAVYQNADPLFADRLMPDTSAFDTPRR